MDASSTSTLYPSKEEIRQWQDSFESLLNHKCTWFVLAWIFWNLGKIALQSCTRIFVVLFITAQAIEPLSRILLVWKNSVSFGTVPSFSDGCLLFRTFLKGEFSDENVDFWIECEEFRKMKEGKKATIQKAHSIYNQYIAEQSPKEVFFGTYGMNDKKVASPALWIVAGFIFPSEFRHSVPGTLGDRPSLEIISTVK